MSEGHFQERCCKCDKVVVQCGCPVAEKALSYTKYPCYDCQGEEGQEDTVTEPTEQEAREALEALTDDLDGISDVIRCIEARASLLKLITDHFKLKAENERYSIALKTIQQWDCLNPPQTELIGDAIWLKSIVEKALKGE